LDARIKFRHLQTFIEAARQKSVGRAADALGVTQPAVTRTIRELEDYLGVDLFEREGRGIRITAFGEVFLRHAGESIAAVNRGVESIAQARKSLGPPLRIGALPTTSAMLLPDAVAEFLKAGTGSRVTIVTGENRWLLDALRLGELDLVVGRLAAPEMMTGLHFEPLYSEEVVFVVRAGHPLLSRSFSLTELNDYTVLVPTRGSVIRPLVDRFLIMHGIAELTGMVETVSDSFGRAYVERHDAVWIISRGVVASEVRSGRMACLDIETAETTRGAVGLTTRADTVASLALDIMAGAIRTRAKAAGGLT
jgi:LysR family pca operon transcriptional activator